MIVWTSWTDESQEKSESARIALLKRKWFCIKIISSDKKKTPLD